MPDIPRLAAGARLTWETLNHERNGPAASCAGATAGVAGGKLRCASGLQRG